MTREEFKEFAAGVLEQAQDVFKYKQTGYGAEDDAFFNFRQSARRFFPGMDESAAMFLVLEILLDKHNCALSKGISVNEIEERLKDRIVYSTIALGIIEDQERKDMVDMVCDDTYRPSNKELEDFSQAYGS